MKIIWSLLLAGIFTANLYAQERNIKFTEYDLDNGIHVILHEDHSTPIVAVSVLYHVGSKNEDPDRTGFAHFFEHLMFEGSKNIDRGKYSEFVEKNGGALNANTSQDRTYYFELLPSNELELGLWLESERMLHAKVDEKGIETQREVVKEEKRQRYDNQPYASFIGEAMERMFTEHPYRWIPIGSMEDLDAAQEEDYINFYKTFYVPANATISIAGDINVEQTKEWIDKYFGSIPKGQAINLYRDFLQMEEADFLKKYGANKAVFDQDDFFKTTSKEGKALIAKYSNMPTIVPRPTVIEPPLTKEIVDTVYDNIQLPAIFITYHSPAENSEDARALEMLNSILSGSSSSRINKSIVEDKQLAVMGFSFALPSEDPGINIFAAIASKDVDVRELKEAIDLEINKAKNELVTENEFQKVKNQLEKSFYTSNSTMAGIAESLANNHVYFKNTNLINEELELYKKITREDLKRVANKYFTDNARLILYYLPKEEESN